MSEEGKELALTEINKEGVADANISASPNVNKIKIRDILRQRFKSRVPFLKKISPFLLIGIICFSLGFGIGKSVKRNDSTRVGNNKVYNMDRGFNDNQKGGQYREMGRGNRR